MDPGPPCCREAGGCISTPSAFWGPNPFSLVHEYLPGSETFHLVLSFHELLPPPAPSSRAPSSAGGTQLKPTGHPHPPTPRLQPAQGPHSQLSLGQPIPPTPLGAPQDQWVHPSRISSQRAFPLAPAADVQAFPAGLSHPSPNPSPHTPPALWNEFTKVPLCLPGTLPFSKSWARMWVWRRAGASCNHS